MEFNAVIIKLLITRKCPKRWFITNIRIEKISNLRVTILIYIYYLVNTFLVESVFGVDNGIYKKI